MLTVAYVLSFMGMIVLPVLLVFYLTRTFNLSWKLALAGALTFIASQVLHIPLVLGLTALFRNGVLSIPDAWSAIFNAVVLGLLAGIFEETARWILFKFVLKNVKTWKEGVLVGAGHGGVEAILLGGLVGLTLAGMIAMRNADLSTFPGIPSDQVELTRQQVEAFWSTPVYMAFLGLFERVFAICLHIALSVMVLYSVVYRKPLWFWVALLWHAFVDAVAVYLLPIVGALAIEGIIGLLAVVSLAILFAMRPRFMETQTDTVLTEA